MSNFVAAISRARDFGDSNLIAPAALSEIAKLLQAGRLKTWVGGVMPLADARIAHEMLDGTRPRPGGKIVLSRE